jgi:2,3-dihydroxybenzoate decarboxylase
MITNIKKTRNKRKKANTISGNNTKTKKNKINKYSWKSLQLTKCAYINPKSNKKPTKNLKKIALEECIIWPYQIKDEVTKPHISYYVKTGQGKNKVNELLDINNFRLKLMNENNVAIQVISPTASGIQYLKFKTQIQQIEKAKEVNNYMYNQISINPTKFKAFAVLPMGSPKEAAKELDRCINNLGMVGALVNGSHIIYLNGKPKALFYDTPEFDILWSKFVELDVPLYLHPTVYPSTDTFVPDKDLDDFYKKYPELVANPFGFHHNLSQHILRMVLSGIFDRFPKLKIILGHMGEFLPWFAERLDHRFCEYKLDLMQVTKSEFKKHKFETWKKPKLTLQEYLRKNIYVTTSGWFSDSALKYVIEKMGIDRVLFSIDYPYEQQKLACDWMDRVPLSNKDKEKIAYKNAEKLLKIKIKI